MAFITKANIKEVAKQQTPYIIFPYAGFESAEDKTLSQQIEDALAEHIFEHNTTDTREIIRQKILNILYDAQDQLTNEGKLFYINGRLIPAYKLKPDVEMYNNMWDLDTLRCNFNKDAQAIVDEFNKANP